MITRRSRGLRAALLPGLTLLIVALSVPASAQKPTPKASATPPAATSSPASAPPATASAAPGRTITLSFARPGAYDYWIVGKSGPGAILTASAGAKSIPVTVPPDAVSLDVMDAGTGLVASLDLTRATAPTATVSPNDFTLLRTVKVTVTNAGKAVEKAQVTLTDANGKVTSRILTADDAGSAPFNDVPLGKATVSASYAANGAKTSTDVTLAPAKGGGPVLVPVALTGDVPTLAASATPAAPSAAAPTTIVVSPPSAEPANTSNPWMSGFLGVMLLCIAGYFGLRAAKNRGVTAEGMLKKMGVETPATTPGGAAAALKPTPAPLPPLPSLSELPNAGPAPTAAAAFSGGAAPAGAVGGPPRLVGIAGAVSGEVFDLDNQSAMTIGRDVANALSLAQDTNVSRRHAHVERATTGWQVVDEGSSNGTFVNGARLGPTPRALRAGDEIQIGGSRFRFEGG